MPPCHGGGRGFESRPVRVKVSDLTGTFLFMAHYVYIIESVQDGTFYKGYSQDPLKRLQQHNQGESKYTFGKMPWKLVYVEECRTKAEALIRERNLKKAERSRIQNLLLHPKNIVGRFTGG